MVLMTAKLQVAKHKHERRESQMLCARSACPKLSPVFVLWSKIKRVPSDLLVDNEPTAYQSKGLIEFQMMMSNVRPQRE
jgi:hypothetical protein